MIQWINEATKQCMKGLVSRWINESINQWINEWSPWFICSLIHWFIDSYVRWLVDSLGHCFVASLVPLIHWFIRSSIQWFIHSVVHGFFHVVSLASQPPIGRSLMHLSQLQPLMASASQNRSHRLLVSYSHLLFLKLPPRRVPGTLSSRI